MCVLNFYFYLNLQFTHIQVTSSKHRLLEQCCSLGIRWVEYSGCSNGQPSTTGLVNRQKNWLEDYGGKRNKHHQFS